MRNIYRHKKFIAWLLVFIWMSFIFYLSHQSGFESSRLSSGFMDKILTVFTWLFHSHINVNNFHFIIRKGAHFFAYFILGMLVVHALFKENNKKKEIIAALFICIMYAITDEIHQSFIPGRSGEIRDVLIDSCGAVIGIGLYIIGRPLLLRQIKSK